MSFEEITSNIDTHAVDGFIDILVEGTDINGLYIGYSDTIPATIDCIQHAIDDIQRHADKPCAISFEKPSLYSIDVAKQIALIENA